MVQIWIICLENFHSIFFLVFGNDAAEKQLEISFPEIFAFDQLEFIYKGFEQFYTNFETELRVCKNGF